MSYNYCFKCGDRCRSGNMCQECEDFYHRCPDCGEEGCTGTCGPQCANCNNPHCKKNECVPPPLYPCNSCGKMTNHTAERNGCPACQWNRWDINFSVDENCVLKGALLQQYTDERTKYLQEKLRNPTFRTEANRYKYWSEWDIDIYDLKPFPV